MRTVRLAREGNRAQRHVNIRATPVSGLGSRDNPPGVPRPPAIRTEGSNLTRYIMENRSLVAEGEGLEPSVPYRVHGLAIRCITALPSLHKETPQPVGQRCTARTGGCQCQGLVGDGPGAGCGR